MNSRRSFLSAIIGVPLAPIASSFTLAQSAPPPDLKDAINKAIIAAGQNHNANLFFIFCASYRALEDKKERELADAVQAWAVSTFGSAGKIGGER